MVPLDDVFADPKTQARSYVFFGREKRLEELGPERRRDAVP
jgi:hypothetical protein